MKSKNLFVHLWNLCLIPYPDFEQKMSKLRANIDVLDANLLELLGKE